MFVEKVKKVLFFIISKIENTIGFFISISLHPQNFNTLPMADKEVYKNKKVAIVMQGPIKKETNFTYETLKLYVNIFPNTIIILSTWQNEDINHINKIKSLGVIVLLNELPQYNGNLNVNYQIVSTRSGIEAGLNAGATHCLKTRTDQRIYKNTTLNLLLSILETFPLDDKYELQNERIIGLNYSTSTRELYWFGDFLLFGDVDDMYRYWSLPLQNQGFEDLLDDNDFRECIKNDSGIVPEMYLTVSYLKALRIQLKWTKNDWWEILRDRFCIIDKENIDLYWYKYLSRFRANNMQTFLPIEAESRIDFSRWLTEYTKNKNERVV